MFGRMPYSREMTGKSITRGQWRCLKKDPPDSLAYMLHFSVALALAFLFLAGCTSVNPFVVHSVSIEAADDHNLIYNGALISYAELSHRLKKDVETSYLRIILFIGTDLLDVDFLLTIHSICEKERFVPVYMLDNESNIVRIQYGNVRDYEVTHMHDRIIYVKQCKSNWSSFIRSGCETIPLSEAETIEDNIMYAQFLVSGETSLRSIFRHYSNVESRQDVIYVQRLEDAPIQMQLNSF